MLINKEKGLSYRRPLSFRHFFVKTSLLWLDLSFIRPTKMSRTAELGALLLAYSRGSTSPGDL